MAKATSESDSTIEGLLQQRAQYEQWLARLDAAGDKAPPSVRERVRSDYEARLRGVIEQLRGHSATISEELDRHRRTQSGLDQEKRTVEEELAEAEVRHAVGEYSEDEWNRLAHESNDRLSRLRGELSGVGHEIARLAEVQGLISGTPKRPEPAPAVPSSPPPAAVAPPREPEPEPEPVHLAEPTPPPAARQAPRAPAREPEIIHGTPPADELAFLKSVAPEDKKPAPPPAPAPASRRSNPGASSPARATETATTQAPTGKSGPAGVAKTLKCGECGTLNRPTEWYCERCGAELAGI
ncbi:MAG TPA: zinc finger Ran-binding domain-containing protein [Gemmatimonadales bacterium]|nr:zinc finger Ran-binding domain-containing protein [Gemmatimonadales bacterium]HET9726164.1 zinc finger Ran-binding domain-containing protein [Gemmatimonadales bacterium]